MKGKMIRQKGFSRKLLDTLQNHKNPKLNTLTEYDVDQFIKEFWRVLADCLKNGIYVSFEGWMSFFTKPVKRECRNTRTGETWVTHKRRLRTKPLDSFRSFSETELTEEEYLILKEKNKK